MGSNLRFAGPAPTTLTVTGALDQHDLARPLQVPAGGFMVALLNQSTGLVERVGAYGLDGALIDQTLVVGGCVIDGEPAASA